MYSLVVRLKEEPDAGRFGDWTHLLFEQAVLAEDGGSWKIRPVSFGG